MATRPHLVIFDCDGVLVDSEPIAAAVLAEFISELGRPTTAETCLDTFTGISIAKVEAIIRDEWGIALPDDFIEQLAARDRVAFAEDLKPMAGVHEMLKQVKAAGVQVCVASSGKLAKMRLTLGLCDLLDAFGEHLYSAEQVAHGKPAPDLFELAARSLHTPPERCLVVEDSTAGIAAAHAAAMAVVGFCGGGHMNAQRSAALVAAGADTIIASLDALPALLDAGA